MSATPVYAAVGLLSTLTFLYWRQTSSRPGEPPLVPYLVPWLGSAISMGKDPDGFFRRAIARYGPIFRLKTAGIEQIYATSPSIISTIYRDPETFIFTPIRLEMSMKSFSTSKSATYSDAMVGSFDGFHKMLSPKEIPVLVEGYIGLMRDIFHDFQTRLPKDGRKSGLKEFILPQAYDAAARTFYGKTFPALSTFADFQTFDDMFALYVADAPNFVVRKGRVAWDNIVNVIGKHLDSPNPGLCALLSEGDALYKSSGWSLRDRAATAGTALWALNANAIWAAYWIIVLQLQRPEGLAPLIAEVDASRAAFAATRDSSAAPLLDDHDGLYAWLSSSGAAGTPLLTSTIQEALRFCSSSFSIRLVTRDTSLAGYTLYKDQKVICMTRAVHLDEEVHEDSAEFVPTRYLDGNKARTKDGKSVPNHTLPFGGGVSMCEGRHFAQAELRAFVALLLSMFTLELDPQSKSRAEFDMTRIGLGIFHAKGDLDVIIRPRHT